MTIALQKGGRVERGALVLVGPGLEMSQSVDGVPILKIADDWEGTTVAPGAGGTGLSQVGSAGTVLVSNGAELYYARIADGNVAEDAAIAASKIDFTGAALDAATLGGHTASDFVLPADLAVGQYTLPLWSVDPGGSNAVVVASSSAEMGMIPNGGAGTVLLGGTAGGGQTGMSFGKVGTAHVGVISASKIDFTGAVLDAATLQGHAASELFAYADGAVAQLAVPGDGTRVHGSNVFGPVENVSEITVAGSLEGAVVVAGSHVDPGAEGVWFNRLLDARAPLSNIPETATVCVNLDADRLDGQHGAYYTGYTDALRDDLSGGGVNVPFAAIDAGASGLAPAALVVRHPAGDSLAGIAPGAAGTVLLGTGALPSFGRISDVHVVEGAAIAASKVNFTDADLSTYSITLGGAHFTGDGAVLDGALHVGTLRIAGLSGSEAPFDIAGTRAMVPNLNAELLGGNDAAYFTTYTDQAVANAVQGVYPMAAGDVNAYAPYGELLMSGGLNAGLVTVPKASGVLLCASESTPPAYGAVRDAYVAADAAIAWSKIAHPTTRDGYGITDVPTLDALATPGGAPVSPGNLSTDGVLAQLGVLGYSLSDGGAAWIPAPSFLSGVTGGVFMVGVNGLTFGEIVNLHVSAEAGIEWDKISKAGAQLGDLGGTLAVTAGGAGVTTAALGDLVYGSGTNTRAVLTGNKTATRKFLGQTGTGSVSAAPVWVQPAFADVTGTVTYAQLPSGSGTWSMGGGTVAVTGSLQPSGVLGIGGAAVTATMLVRAGGNTSGGAAQYGLSADPAGDATATSSVTGGLFRARTQAAGFTTAALYGIEVAAPLLGTGSAATTAVGLRILNQTGAATNYSMQVGTAPSAFAGSVLVGALALPDASAAVEVRSTTQGFLPPRMTATQRDSIATPPDGLIVYNTTAGKLNLREAGAWKTLTSA